METIQKFVRVAKKKTSVDQFKFSEYELAF